jgi:hypothetical protein
MITGGRQARGAAYELHRTPERVIISIAMNRTRPPGRYVGAAARRRYAAACPGRAPDTADGVGSTEVREWAKAQGIEVKDRGRVPAGLMVKFKAATGQ